MRLLNLCFQTLLIFVIVGFVSLKLNAQIPTFKIDTRPSSIEPKTSEGKISKVLTKAGVEANIDKRTSLDKINVKIDSLKALPDDKANEDQIQDQLKQLTDKQSKLISGTQELAVDSEQEDDDDYYFTKELTDYNYLVLDENKMLINLGALKRELRLNSKGHGRRFTPEEMQGKQKEATRLESELRQIEKKKDSLYYIYTRDYVNFRRSIAFGFGPLRSKAFFDILYNRGENKFQFVNSSGFNFGQKSASFYSELFSGQMSIFRVSVGALIATSQADEGEAKEKELEAYQRLATYGGNTILTLEYPLVYLHTPDKQWNLVSRAQVKGAMDLPAFGTNTDKVAGSVAAGVDLYMDAATDNDEIRLFLSSNLYRVKGTPEYRNNLGVGSTAFYFGQLMAGVVLGGRIKISVIFHNFSSQELLRNNKIIGGGQVLSSK
jgi:hypothetical protein